MKKLVVLFLIFFGAKTANAQQYKPESLKDFRLSVNASVMPSELTTSSGISTYVNYKKILFGFTWVSGATGRQESRSGSLTTFSRTYLELYTGSAGFEVADDLFLKAGYGVLNLRGNVQVVNSADNDRTTTTNFNDLIDAPSFGILYMNTPNHFNLGFDLVGTQATYMIFSLGFNL